MTEPDLDCISWPGKLQDEEFTKAVLEFGNKINDVFTPVAIAIVTTYSHLCSQLYEAVTESLK